MVICSLSATAQIYNSQPLGNQLADSKGMNDLGSVKQRELNPPVTVLHNTSGAQTTAITRRTKQMQPHRQQSIIFTPNSGLVYSWRYEHNSTSHHLHTLPQGVFPNNEKTARFEFLLKNARLKQLTSYPVALLDVRQKVQ